MNILIQPKSILFIVIVFLFIGCSTNKIVVERKIASQIMLPKDASIEIQGLQGPNSDTFQLSLNQILTERTAFKIIHSQSRDELIDSMLRGNKNKQIYAQADFIIKGIIQENVERRTGQDGIVQFAAISSPFLQLIEAASGKVICSKYFVGTSQSSTYMLNSNIGYDGYTDALTSARTMAIEKFISQFRPQISWLEIELLPLKDGSKYKEAKNLISHGRYEDAKSILGKYISTLLPNETAEKGNALVSLSVVESLLGNYTKAKSLILEAHRLTPDERIIEYLNIIASMELESKRLIMNQES